MWDVFISYASEDKDDLVKPLVEALKQFEIKVWYDEFELKLGDSLSKSIDKGLLNSRFGVVVLSPAFFAKGWADYELRSLIGKEIGKEKVILPIWHNIERDEIVKHSLFLADKFAISSKLSFNELAEKIIEIIRPDIINSIALKAFGATMRSKAKKTKKVHIKNLTVLDGVRHKTLPYYMVISTKLISDIFADIGNMDYNSFLVNFAKDFDYEPEYLVWIAIASSYISYIQLRKIDFSDIKKKECIFTFLLCLSMGQIEKDACLSDDDRLALANLYCENMELFASLHNN